MMINQAMRYLLIMDILRKRISKRKVEILEVGSGSRGLGDYVRFELVGCDLRFEGKIASNLLPIIGSAEHLPFRDNSFDVVVSSDMLEHIERQKRETVVHELLRVAKEEVIIACPCGKNSEDCERKIALLCKLICRRYPDWLIDHFKKGLPSEKGILHILMSDEKVEHFCVLDNENIAIHQIVIILESIPFIGLLSNIIAKLLSVTKKGPAVIKLFNFGMSYRKIFVISVKGVY
jgi:hypothetical protein